ncbi:MAG: hypothetical protein R2710_05015 [Acidimicrobiales bacterium]
MIETIAPLFDDLIVGVGHNPEKPSGLFTPDGAGRHDPQRGRRPHQRSGRTFRRAGHGCGHRIRADCLVKGVRGAGDLDAEMQQAAMNSLTAGVPTLFAPAMGEASLVSSRYVREIAAMGGDINSVVLRCRRSTQ